VFGRPVCRVDRHGHLSPPGIPGRCSSRPSRAGDRVVSAPRMPVFVKDFILSEAVQVRFQ
jgi:hypothetical protein